MDTNKEGKKPNEVEKFDKSHRKLKEGEAPNNPATNNNIPFDEGQFETENELPVNNGDKEDN